MAHRLYDITSLEPLISDGFTLLTPNSRLARRIISEWNGQRAAAGEQVWHSPAVQPLQSWLLTRWERAVRFDLLPPLAPLDVAQTAELWRQVIAEHGNRSGDYHLLSPAAAVEIASQARDSLLLWQVDPGQRAVRQSFELDQDCGTFLLWLQEFERRLAKIGACTPTDCLLQLLSLNGAMPAERVALVEVEEIPPLIDAALRAMCTTVHRVKPGTHRAECIEHAFSDKRAELQAVAGWAATMHRQDSQATIGIVLTDMSCDRQPLEYLLRREFGCLSEDYTSLPVNFSTGIPLAQVPLVRDALAVLAMNLQRATVPAVASLMHSRFVDLPDAHSALAQLFVTRLYDRGRYLLDIGELRVAASEVQLGEEHGLELGQRLQAIYQQRELRRRTRPSQWVERFTGMLSQWGWPGNGPLDSLEFQQQKLWYQTLDEFKALDAVCAPLEFDEALRLLHESCARQMSQPQTLDSPIQVLGPLEAAGLNFQHLWLVGMQGSKWPPSPRPNPFIPVALQSRLQMPHASAAREWAFSDTLLKQYQRACNIFHASYCRQIDGVPEPRSALLAEFAPQDVGEHSPVASTWLEYQASGVMEQLTDERAPPLDPAMQHQIKGGSGLLEDQSQCPFRAFARRRLRVEPLSEFSIAQSPGERGSLLHDALYALWGEVSDHAGLMALNEDQQERVVANAVQQGIAAIPGKRRHGLGNAYWDLEGQRLASLLHEWLAVERQRSAFSVAQREQDVPLELAQLQIRLRVDRVDLLPDGSQVIIDYKSGEGKVKDWLGERPARPQLLLYGIAAPDQAAALAFAQVRPRECGFVGLGLVEAAPGISTDIARAVKSKADVQDWQSLNDYWRANLERLARSFVNGDAAVDPLTTSSCTWCGLQPLCRVDMATAAPLSEQL